MSIMNSLFAAIIALLASTAAAVACQCARSDITPAQVLDKFDVVFTGVAIEAIPAGKDKRSSFTTTTFKVVEGFKGVKAGQSIKVRHRSGSPGACGFSFELGETHAVPAQKWAGDFSATQCQRIILRGERGEQLIKGLRTLQHRPRNY